MSRWLFLLGFFAALVQLPLGIDASAFGAKHEVLSVAQNLAATGQFRDPFGSATGLTAHVAPVYPFLLALLAKVHPSPGLFAGAAIFLNALLLGFTASVLPRIAQSIFGHRGAGTVGGVLLIFCSRMAPQWEGALTAALLAVAALAILEKGRLASGLWAGLSMLANPVSAPVLLVLMISRGRRFAIASMALALTVCAPWMLRNWAAVGSPYFIRDNFGLELYLSNNDLATARMIQNPALWSLHPTQNPNEAKLVAALGEGPYNRLRQRDAIAWIAAHPAKFAQLTAGRMLEYWFPGTSEGWPVYVIWLATALGAAGTWLARRNGKALLAAAASFVYFLPFLLIQTAVRYRYPSLWLCTILAGYAVMRIYETVRSPLGRDRVHHSPEACAARPARSV